MRFCGSAYGSYNLLNKEIRLASPEFEVFLHELSHAVDDRITGLRPGQRKDQEVTAEFSAAVIAHLMGYKVPLGNVREYIENYSFRELMSCLARIEKIVSLLSRGRRQALNSLSYVFREAGHEVRDKLFTEVEWGMDEGAVNGLLCAYGGAI